jgi:hypothetical protein
MVSKFHGPTIYPFGLLSMEKEEATGHRLDFVQHLWQKRADNIMKR